VRSSGTYGALLLLVVGCAPEEPGAPAANVDPSPPPSSGADSDQARPSAEGAIDAGNGPVPEPASTPEPEVLRVDRIAQGAVLRPHPAVSLGLVGVERRPEETARISVGRDPYAFDALLRLGERLHVAGGELRLSALSAGGGVEVEWLRFVPADLSLGFEPVPAAETTSVAAMGLYALADERVLAVGNVRRVNTPGEAARLGVTLALYPAGYGSDPSLGYDLHLDAGEGALPGAFGELVIERIVPAEPSTRGAVQLRIR
jgi:hypothetical protein